MTDRTDPTADLPEGYELRPAPRLSASTLRRRPLAYFRGDLRRLAGAGAGAAWITPRVAGFGSDAGTVSALHSRGALLIAERRSAKLYRLTARGAAEATR